jgi:hypothetical protein
MLGLKQEPKLVPMPELKRLMEPKLVRTLAKM